MDQGIHGAKYGRAITFKEFFERNNQFIITENQNIIKVIRRHQEIKT